MSELEETTPGPFFAGLVAPLRRRPGEPLSEEETREMRLRHYREAQETRGRVHVMKDDEDEEPAPKRAAKRAAQRQTELVRAAVANIRRLRDTAKSLRDSAAAMETEALALEVALASLDKE